uniref:C2H2-type domain-containing protein n=1 Tax=Plectus sambesii TaxID=2011161 RepID=A0A914VVB2_9BILA
MAKFKKQPASSLSKSYELCNVFQCTRQYCKEIFNDFEELRKHHEFVHGNDEGYQLISCHVCRASFDSQIKLDLHKKTHANIMDGGVKKTVVMRKCPHCTIQLNTKASLEQHIRACHGGKSLPIDLRKLQQPAVLSPKKPSPKNKTTGRQVPSLSGSVNILQSSGAVHASDIMEASFSRADSSEPSGSNSVPVEGLTEVSPHPDDEQNLFNIMRIAALASSEAESTSSQPTNRAYSARGNHFTSFKTYSCQKCGTSFKNRCSLTLHEMKHKQNESDFRCTAPKCYCAYKSKKKLRSHMTRSHPELFGKNANKMCGGVGFEALMSGGHFGMCSSGDDLLEDEESLQTSERTTEILIIPKYATVADDAVCSSSSLVGFVDAKFEVTEGGCGDSLIVDKGMSDESDDQDTSRTREWRQSEMEKAAYEQLREKSIKTSLDELKPSSSAVSAIAIEFEQLDKALSCPSAFL